MPVIDVQRRFMQLGRVRLGEKGPKGEPKKLSTFRFTSASDRLLQAVATRYGGTVSAWTDAPDQGYFQVTTEATSLDIILPPTFSQDDGTPSMSYSQWYELWSAGGCQRRCDGVTESLTGERCLCDSTNRECDIITRVSFLIPDLPGLGVWRLDSGGWNAAVELPGTLQLLADAAMDQRFIPAVLSVQNRTSKVDGQTRRFVVPVIELPDVTLEQLLNGSAPTLSMNAPAPVNRERPELPAAPPPPRDPSFESDNDIPFGSPPALPAPEPRQETLDEAPRLEFEVVNAPEAQQETREYQPTPEDQSLVERAEKLPQVDAEIKSLLRSLRKIAKERGKLDLVNERIYANRDGHRSEPEAHRDWLRDQLSKAMAKEETEAKT